MMKKEKSLRDKMVKFKAMNDDLYWRFKDFKCHFSKISRFANEILEYIEKNNLDSNNIISLSSEELSDIKNLLKSKSDEILLLLRNFKERKIR